MSYFNVKAVPWLGVFSVALIFSCQLLLYPPDILIPTAAPRRVAEIYRDLLVLMHGRSVSVIGSPELCSGAIAPPLDSASKLNDWYFSTANCRLTYRPDFTAVVSPLSERSSKVQFRSVDSRMRLVSVLDEMIQAVQVSNISIQERLIIQTTAWELAFGLDWFGLNDAEMQRGLEPAIHRAVRLLKITPFSSDEAKRVPSTLGDLPRLAAAPEMASDVKSLLAHNPDIVEVTVPTELHADLLFGRFTARIFLTTTDPTSRVSFRQFVMEKNTQYKDLRDLPLKFAGIKAILVLYFNVLSSDLKIIPTEQVAFWHQYTFTEKTDLGLPFNEAANRIRFFTVAFENRLGRPSSADIAPITYKQIS